jgi:hypothetical protein
MYFVLSGYKSGLFFAIRAGGPDFEKFGIGDSRKLSAFPEQEHGESNLIQCAGKRPVCHWFPQGCGSQQKRTEEETTLS